MIIGRYICLLLIFIDSESFKIFHQEIDILLLETVKLIVKIEQNVE